MQEFLTRLNGNISVNMVECPNCGAIWGFEEIDWQQCDCCGYPDNDDLNEYDDYLDDDNNE